MKKMLLMLLALVLWAPALAETLPAIPAEIVSHDQAQIPLETAITNAMAALPVQPEKYQTRAELVRMSDGRICWVVTVFDLSTLIDAWCVEVDASTGAVAASYTTYDGFFQDVRDLWTTQKGIHALWSMEDKQLFDALYAMLPRYGLPIASIPDGNALTLALNALGLQSADGYEVGYGYLMFDDGIDGMWEISLVKDGQLVYQVNLDSSEIYYIYPDEAGNG